MIGPGLGTFPVDASDVDRTSSSCPVEESTGGRGGFYLQKGSSACIPPRCDSHRGGVKSASLSTSRLVFVLSQRGFGLLQSLHEASERPLHIARGHGSHGQEGHEEAPRNSRKGYEGLE